MYRNTYTEVNLTNITNNIKKIINKYNKYKYYFGVVKADSYGHYDNKSVEAIIKGGCNYLAVATLDEALEIRKYNKVIPIICLGIIPIEYLDLCHKHNITITLSNKEYVDELLKTKYKKLTVHIKVNTGMNRLGVNNSDDFNYIYNKVINSKLILEGVYTHIYNSANKKDTLKQFDKFKCITNNVDLKSIPIVHIAASETVTNYDKLDIVNGCRLGLIMYGFTNDSDLSLETTFKIISEVIQINDVENETVGYNGIYKCNKKEHIAVIPIGYADGIIRKNTGRYVYINDKKYKIVGNICMDMLFVKVDNSVKVHDKVYIVKDNKHTIEIAKHLETIPYEILCSITKRVPRKYVK